MNTAAYLKAQGWRGEGFSLDHTNRGIARPLLVDHKKDLAGLGTKKNDFGNQWWLNAFDKSLSSLGSTPLGSPAPQLAEPKKSGLYARFVKADTLGGTHEELKSVDTVSKPVTQMGEQVEGKKRKLDDALAGQPPPQKKSKKDKSTREKRGKRKDEEDKSLEVKDSGQESTITKRSKSQKRKDADVKDDVGKVDTKKLKKETSTKTDEDKSKRNKREARKDHADRKAEKARQKKDVRVTESGTRVESMPKAPEAHLDLITNNIALPVEAFINPARLAMMDPQARPQVPHRNNGSNVATHGKTKWLSSGTPASQSSVAEITPIPTPEKNSDAKTNGTGVTRAPFINPARLAIMDPSPLGAATPNLVPVKKDVPVQKVPSKSSIKSSEDSTQQPQSKTTTKGSTKKALREQRKAEQRERRHLKREREHLEKKRQKQEKAGKRMALEKADASRPELKQERRARREERRALKVQMSERESKEE